MTNRPQGALAEALAACGIDPLEVSVEWDELCQEDVLTFSAANIPDTVLTALVGVHLSFSSRFVFATEDLDQAFQDRVLNSPEIVAIRDRYRSQLQEWLTACGLDDFAPFDSGRESVSDFVSRVEIACGAEKGELLSVDDNATISVKPRDPGNLKVEQVKTLMALMETYAPGLFWSVTGQETREVP